MVKLSRRRRHQKRHTRRRQRGGKLCDSDTSEYDITGKKTFGGGTWYMYEYSPSIVIKKIGPAKWVSEEDLRKELDTAVKASTLSIGPPVYHTTICKIDDKYVGYIVMEKILGVTFDDLPKDKVDELTPERNRLLDILYDNGVVVLDKAKRNVMYGHTSSDPVDRVWLIDFGYIQYKDVKKGERNYEYND